jgi:hypothetical protein
MELELLVAVAHQEVGIGVEQWGQFGMIIANLYLPKKRMLWELYIMLPNNNTLKLI